MEASTQISKESWEATQCVAGSRSLQTAFECVICEAVRVNLSFSKGPGKLEMPGVWNVCWGDLQAASTAGPGEKQYKQALGAGLPEHFGAHTMLLCSPDVRHRVTGFNACLAGSWPCFRTIPPSYAYILPFWNRNVYLMPLYIGII
jgi:hypothetical protein